MKIRTVIYWITNVIIVFELFAGGTAELLNLRQMLIAGQPVHEVITRLGYPLYFSYILGVCEILGGIALLIPRFPRLKEWAYAGTFFVMSGAVVSHAVHGSGAHALIPPTIFAVVTLISWYFYPKVLHLDKKSI